MLIISLLPYREMDVSCMFASAKHCVNNRSHMRYTQMCHHHTDHLQAWKDLQIEKDFTTWKDCLRPEKAVTAVK